MTRRVRRSAHLRSPARIDSPGPTTPDDPSVAGAAPQPPERGATFRSLRERNVRLFFAGLLVSNIGTWIQATAVVLLVRSLGGTGFDLGVVLACQFLPMLLFGLWFGGFADRHDRFRTTMAMQAAMGIQALAMGFVALTDRATIPLVNGLTVVLGVLAAMDNPARRGLVLELVSSEDIGNVMSLNTSVMTGSRAFGPALAALLVSVIGVGWCFVLNGVSFIALLGALWAMDQSRRHRVPPAPRGGRPVREGLAAVWSSSELRLTLIVFAVVSTFAFNYSVALPLLIERLGADDRVFGWLLSVVSFGSVIGSLLVARRYQVGQAQLAASLATLSASGVVLALAPNLPVAFAAAIPLGIGGAGFIACSNVIFQSRTDAQMRSRVLALTAVAFLGSTPIGGPITGWIGDHWGARWSLLYGSLIAGASVTAAVVILRRRSEPRAGTVPG